MRIIFHCRTYFFVNQASLFAGVLFLGIHTYIEKRKGFVYLLNGLVISCRKLIIFFSQICTCSLIV